MYEDITFFKSSPNHLWNRCISTVETILLTLTKMSLISIKFLVTLSRGPIHAVIFSQSCFYEK